MPKSALLIITMWLRGVLSTQCEPQNKTIPEYELDMPIPKFYILRPKGFGLKFPITEKNDEYMFLELWYRLNTPLNRTYLIEEATCGGFRSTGCNWVYEKRNLVFKDTDVLYFVISVMNVISSKYVHLYRVFCHVDVSEYICNVKHKNITAN